VHARQTIVKRIDKQAAADFLNRNHLQQDTSSYYKLALMYKEQMIAAATFSKGRTMKDRPQPYRSFELLRFASQAGFTVNGGLGKLLAHFSSLTEAAHIMTYSDRDWSVGKSYRKLGFNFDRNMPPQAFYLDPEKMIRFPMSRKKEEEDAMLKAGCIRIYNAGSGRWIRWQPAVKADTGSGSTA
jgi:hypothetical protein